MSWSASWAAKARAPAVVPVYVLRVISDGPQPSWSSHPVTGTAVCLLPLQSSIQWGRTGLHQWQQPVSSASFALTPDADVYGVMQGSVVQLSIILAGEEEPVWVGSLQQIARTLDGPITLTCQGMEGALWSRMVQLGVTSTREDRLYFPETEDVTVLSANFTAGVSTTVSLAGSPDLQKRTGAGGVYVIRINPSVGEPFYLAGDTWSDPVLSDTSGSVYTVLDTVAVNATTSDPVTPCAYDVAHPLALVARSLASTSAWPDQWKMGLPSGVFDADETNAQLANCGLTATEQLAYVWCAEQPHERIGDVMGPLLSSVGAILCQRQGMIAPRLLPTPTTITAGDSELFTRSDIVDAQWQAWAVTTQAMEFRVYDRTKRGPLPLGVDDITTPYGSLAYACTLLGMPVPPPPASTGAAVTGSSPSGVLRGTPVQDYVEVRIPAYGPDRNNVRAELYNRMRPYHCERPERLTVTLLGWLPYTIGDSIRVDLPQLPCRGQSWGGITTSQPAVIVGGGPDYFGATTTYEVIAVPSNADDT